MFIKFRQSDFAKTMAFASLCLSVALSLPSRAFASESADRSFGEELACLDGLTQLMKDPNSRVITRIDDSKTDPVAVITGVNYKDHHADLIFTPVGFYVHEYDASLFTKGAANERYVEVPASEAGKQPLAYYHGSPNAADGSAEPSAEKPRTRLEDFPFPKMDRVGLVRLDASYLNRGKNHPAVGALHQAIIRASREFRKNFDQSPALRDDASMAKLSGTLDHCMQVKALRQGVDPEIELFEYYVYQGDKLKADGSRYAGYRDGGRVVEKTRSAAIRPARGTAGGLSSGATRGR